MKAPLYLIDAYGLIYRSYFAFTSRPLYNPAGKNISALFGFSRTVAGFLEEGLPAAGEDRRVLRLAAAFDSRTPTFRHKKYPAYKATRQKAPDDLHPQVALIEEFLAALGVRALRADGYEADDIIATLARQCRAEGRRCYIISSDKDLLQLAGNGVWQLRPAKRPPAGKGQPGQSGQPAEASAWELIGPEEIRAEWGVPPEKVLDLLALAGDTSDNVPGVKGIGEKTAAKLVARYASLEGIYENIAGIEGATGKKLAEGKEAAFFARELIALDDSVPLSIDNIDVFSVENPDRRAAAEMLLREGIRQVSKMLDPEVSRDVSRQDALRQDALRQDASRQDASRQDLRHQEAPPGAGRAEGANQPPAVSTAERMEGAGQYRTVTSPDEFRELMEAARRQALLSLDFETDSLDAWNARPIGLSFALEPKKAYYAPVAPHAGEQAAPFIDPSAAREILAALLADPALTVIAHNAKFDYKVSRGWGIPRWNCRIWDTMIAAWLDDPERGNYSLDSLVAFFIDYSALSYRDIVPKGATFDKVDLETATRYSAEDADLSFRMKIILEERLARAGAETEALFRDLEMPLLPVLAEMEGLGIKIEPEALTEYGVELARELKAAELKTWATVGHEFNLGSTKQLQEVLFTERGLRPGKKTKTGFSTDMAVLEELARIDAVPALILRHRTLSKLKSTYVDSLAALADKNRRLHTNFVQTGTATGRLSSREPNLQNIPVRDEEGRRIREAFVAGTGQVLISADYSQIELAVLAHLSGDPNLVSAFREGRDIHTRTAALIFGIKEENVDGAQRRIAKTINFGVIYGMSAFRLSGELGIGRGEAQAFIEAYFRTYAGVRDFMDGLVRSAEETGYALTISGRRRPIRAINSRNKTEKSAAERVAINTPIQGSAADIVKTAMLALDRRITDTGSTARLLLQVHDELILECPKPDAEKTAAMVREVMETAVSLSVPLRVSVETGRRWGDFH